MTDAMIDWEHVLAVTAKRIGGRGHAPMTRVPARACSCSSALGILGGGRGYSGCTPRGSDLSTSADAFSRASARQRLLRRSDDRLIRRSVVAQTDEPLSILNDAAAHECDPFQRQRIWQRVDRERPFLAANDDIATQQLGQVLGHQLMLLTEHTREIGHRPRTGSQHLQHLQPERMTKRPQPTRGEFPSVS